MNHLTEEELILYYYGETAEAAETHLADCERCRAAYADLQRVLNVVDGLPVPERGDDYGRHVWQRLGLERRGLWSPWRYPLRWWAAIAAVTALLIAAFLAGRYSPRASEVARQAGSGSGQVRERILLVALGNHLERSQMVLVELANADPTRTLDISEEQQRADDLISENRLYRQTAMRTGDRAVAGVLDELERILLEIARGPSRLAPADLEHLRQRIQAEGILFKVRIIGSEVQNKEERAVAGARQKTL